MSEGFSRSFNDTQKWQSLHAKFRLSGGFPAVCREVVE
jgi:hypothetical protein